MLTESDAHTDQGHTSGGCHGSHAARQCRLRTGALEKHIELVCQWLGGLARGQAELPCLGESEVADIGDGHARGAEGPGDLSGVQPDRAGARYQHAIARADSGLPSGPHTNRDRLSHGGLLRGEALRRRMREGRVDCHEPAD